MPQFSVTDVGGEVDRALLIDGDLELREYAPLIPSVRGADQ
jgi:hypothetical protein